MSHRCNGVSSGNYTVVVTQKPTVTGVTGVKVALCDLPPHRSRESHHASSPGPFRHRLPAGAGPRCRPRRPHPGLRGGLPRHRRGAPGRAAGATAAARRAASATVPTDGVTPTVTEVPLTGTGGGFAGLARPYGRRRRHRGRVTSKPQAVTRLRRRRRHLGRTARTSTRTRSPSGCAPARATRGATGRTWSTTTTTRPTPDSAEAATPAPAPSRCSSATSTPSRSRPATDDATLPDDLSLAVVDPGSANATETEAPADRPPDDPTASYDEEYAEQGGDAPLRRHQPAGGAPAGRRAADDLHPRPVGCRRVDPQQELAALRLDQRRLRAPHGQRQRLHRGRRCRPSSAASTPTT